MMGGDYMGNYYSENLNATKLFDVYQTEIIRVRQYLDAEIEFVRSQLYFNDKILEMGAGYGRIMKEISPSVQFISGIDISENTVAFGQEYLKEYLNCDLKTLDVYKLDKDSEYDAVLCLQNGISAFKGRDLELIDIAMKALKNNAKAYFSSYSEAFWEYRLAWFQEQAQKGLLGEIDYEKTKNGNIVCKDGFSATTFSKSDMERLGKASGYDYVIREIDNSSIFLIIQKTNSEKSAAYK